MRNRIIRARVHELSYVRPTRNLDTIAMSRCGHRGYNVGRTHEKPLNSA